MKRVASNRIGLMGAVAAVALLTLAGCSAQQPSQSMNIPGSQTDEATRARVDRLVAYCQKLSKAGEFYLASGMCGKAHDLDPTNPLPLLVMADNYEKNGSPEQALTAYQAILKSHPQNAEASYRLAKLQLAQGYEDEALRTLETALERSPGDARLLNAMGVIQDQNGQHESAQLYYRRALDADPDNISISSNLGLSLALSGRGDEAVDVLSQVVSDPDATETSRHNLALAYSAIDAAPAAERTEAATARPEDNESTYGEPIEVQSLEQQSMLNPKDTSPLSTLFSSESPAETTEPTPLLTSSFAAQAGYNSTTGETEANYQPIFGGMFMPGARTVNQTNR